VACFRRATLPVELRDCAVVDFRGRFRPALAALLRVLARSSDAALNQAKHAWPAVPPWVAVMTLLLALPTLGYFMAASWSLDHVTENRLLVLAMVPLGVLGIAWFFCVAFLRRRMGMTRLALCLLCLSFVFGFQLQRYFAHDADLIANTDLANMVGSHWRAGIVLLAAPLLGLLTLLVLRPEDLLRWTPTGKAWAGYRLGHVANAAFGQAELSARFHQVGSFALLFDPADAPLALRLREQLLAQGATEPSTEGVGPTQVLLLTNRTQVDWLDAQMDRLRADCITVVGTGIGLPPKLDWLWRRQWIDFRTWNIGRPEPARALPQVPDAVTQSRLPSRVARVHHLLCALAAVVFAFAGALMPDDRGSQDLSLPELMSILGFAVAAWWALIAHRLVKRSRAAQRLFRDTGIAWAVTAIVLGVDGYALVQRGFAAGRVALVALFLVAAWIWLARQRAAMGFWLPQQDITAATKRGALAQYRDWSTLGWWLLYAGVWMWVLGLLK
jgi:hypothetical protein